MIKKLATIITLGGFLALTACSSHKSPNDQPFGATDSTNADQTEGIYDNATPLPARVENSNPEGADYQTLSQYIVYFDTDSFAIKADERPKLEAIAKWFETNSNAKLIIAGHCDARGTTQYNLALGERRSLAVRDYLIGLGIAQSQLSTISYGKERPAVQGNDEAAWSKNRRVETGILR
jgi:peptidoglycan-associated lipoprotein